MDFVLWFLALGLGGPFLVLRLYVGGGTGPRYTDFNERLRSA